MDLADSIKREITFWRQVIDRQPEGTPAEVLERMSLACELALQKLAQLEQDGENQRH